MNQPQCLVMEPLSDWHAIHMGLWSGSQYTLENATIPKG